MDAPARDLWTTEVSYWAGGTSLDGDVFAGLFALPLELGDVTFFFTTHCSKNCTHRAFVSVYKRGQMEAG
jgi:hypothetical protein